MRETHRNINRLNRLPNGKLLRCLKICVDSLVWIEDNSLFNEANKIRARDTIKQINKILGK